MPQMLLTDMSGLLSTCNYEKTIVPCLKRKENVLKKADKISYPPNKTISLVKVQKDDGGVDTFSMFVDGTKLGGVADMPEGHVAIQRDLNRLEKQADQNLTMSHKVNCRVLHLGSNHTRWCGLGTAQLENSSAEKDLEVPVHNRLNMGQHALRKGK
ncbi:hypothetical protein DUI87_07246 [Hirundo rustica rustica]|uniref:Uncharacterized protein n=1 Tax=Hirundo rustica rustica TaxID=333673 RepID=A0A3M0KPS7_HIRRU|nr:hypothetical protein DUI87_07246 [Hirundo rustica rustica]